METDLVHEILELARRHNVMIATAESCTGGMIAAALTDIPGSSDMLDRGYVTYSDAAKTAMLSVDPALIARHGAVSEEVVCAMASGAVGAIDHRGGRIAISVSGIAGPDGGSDEKPVGLVWFGIAAYHGETPRIKAEKIIYDGDRDSIRAKATRHALVMVRDCIQAFNRQ